MMFLECIVTKDNEKYRNFKLISDLETATATLNKETGKVVIKGFKDSLEYVYPKGFVEDFILSVTKNDPNNMDYAYGRG